MLLNHKFLLSVIPLVLLAGSVSAEPIFPSFQVADAQNSDNIRGFRFTYDGDDPLEVVGLGMFDLLDGTASPGIPGTPGYDSFNVSLWKFTGTGSSFATPFANVELPSGLPTDPANVGVLLEDESASGPYTSSELQNPGPVYYRELASSVFLTPGDVYQLTVNFFNVNDHLNDQEFWSNPVSISVATDFTILNSSAGNSLTSTNPATLNGAGANWGQVGQANTNAIQIAQNPSENEVIGPTLVFGSTEAPVTGVPEPSSMALFLLAAVGGVLRYRKK